MMQFQNKHTGFTLLELLVVIAIIGVLASVVVVSMQQSSRLGRNAGVLKQMYEYQSALDMYHLVEGSFPSGFSTPLVNFRSRLYCIGDEFTGGDACMTFMRDENTTSHIEQVLVPDYIGRIRHVKYGVHSSPGYNGCSTLCTNTGCTYAAPISTNPECSDQNYSLFYVLEGVNEDCGRGTQISSNLGGDGFTWCQLRESRN